MSYCLAYTVRDGRLRAISLRRSRAKEMKRHVRRAPPMPPDDAPFDDPDNPEWTEEDFARAEGPESMSEVELDAFPRTRALLRGRQKAPTKEPVSLRLDADVVAWFRGTGEGWQTRINDILRRSLPAAAAPER